MNMAKIEARAAELHESCRMPMEQARELAVSEAGPDWYARGQDWGLADALTNCQNGDWTLDDIARAFAAGAQAGTLLEGKRTHEIECRCVALEEQADLTAIHLSRMQSTLDQKHAEYEDLKQTMRDQIRNATDARRGEIAYQLTKRLVIDMPTARAAVDSALGPNGADEWAPGKP